MKITNMVIIVCSVSVLSGCATYKKKFGKGTVANIGFFTDSTVTMMSSLNLQQGRDESLLTRRFVSLDEPEEQLLVKMDLQFQATVQSLIEYSLKIVNIAEGTETELEMVEKYAMYLEQFRDTMVQHEVVDIELFEDTLEEVRTQEKFLDALRKAQPLLNAAGMDAIVNIDALLKAFVVVVDKIELKIDAEYAYIVHYREILEDEKSDILSGFEIIYNAYKTEEPDLSNLHETGVIWLPELIPEGRPTREDLKKLGEHLEGRLNAMHRIQQEVDPDWNDYLETHRELKLISKRTMSMVQETQIMMLTWVRAHQKMSAGMTDPADWFDIGDSTKSLLKSAPKAVL